MSSIGCILAQRLTAELAWQINKAGVRVEHKLIENIVYGEMNRINSEQSVGDWIEFPNGSNYTLTFKPQKN